MAEVSDPVTVEPPPRMLAVAHGTASVRGRSTVRHLVSAIAAERRDTIVDLCFLDVIDPRLPVALDERPTIVVPLLLSTGYHVQSDIPAALEGRAATSLARHLGPHPLLVDALVDRLPTSRRGTTALAAAGSTRDDASVELTETARLLSDRLDEPVRVLTMSADLERALADPAVTRVATYLLAEGRFTENLRRAAPEDTTVAPVLGAHPALVRLAWQRYDDAIAARNRDEPVR